MLERLKKRVDRARFFANVIRSAKLARPVRPSSLVEFAKSARKTPPAHTSH